MGDMNLRRCLDEAETYGEIKEIADYTDASAFRSFTEHLEGALESDGRAGVYERLLRAQILCLF